MLSMYIISLGEMELYDERPICFGPHYFVPTHGSWLA